MDPCSGGNSQVLHNNSFNKGAWGSPASFILPPPPPPRTSLYFPAFLIFPFPPSSLFPLPNFSISVRPPQLPPTPPCLLFVSSVIKAITISGGAGWGGGGEKRGRGKTSGERCWARASNIGRVHSSLPQITAINQPGQELSHQLDLKHWVPLDKPADLHIYWRERSASWKAKRNPWLLNCHLI